MRRLALLYVVSTLQLQGTTLTEHLPLLLVLVATLVCTVRVLATMALPCHIPHSLHLISAIQARLQAMEVVTSPPLLVDIQPGTLVILHPHTQTLLLVRLILRHLVDLVCSAISIFVFNEYINHIIITTKVVVCKR